MTKDDLIQVRISTTKKEEIRKYAKAHGYEDMTKFIVDLIEEKIEPERYDEKFVEGVIKIFKSEHVEALINNKKLLDFMDQRYGYSAKTDSSRKKIYVKN